LVADECGVHKALTCADVVVGLTDEAAPRMNVVEQLMHERAFFDALATLAFYSHV
jgi:hypothetical protein